MFALLQNFIKQLETGHLKIKRLKKLTRKRQTQMKVKKKSVHR